jgi:tubulin beta
MELQFYWKQNKMKEICQIQIGQCGINISQAFWEKMIAEHGVGFDRRYTGKDDSQIETIHTYFNSTTEGEFIPRSIIVDYDPAPIDEILSGKMSNLFYSDNFLHSDQGTENNWSLSMYNKIGDVGDLLENIIRKEAES